MNHENESILIFFYTLCIFLHPIFISDAGAANKIMPLGDSITQGTSSGVTDEDFQVSYCIALYDRFVQGKLAEWLTTEKPNIVLLHIGTNDVSVGNEGWDEVEDVLVVIDDYEATSGKSVWVI